MIAHPDFEAKFKNDFQNFPSKSTLNVKKKCNLESSQIVECNISKESVSQLFSPTPSLPLKLRDCGSQPQNLYCSGETSPMALWGLFHKRFTSFNMPQKMAKLVSGFTTSRSKTRSDIAKKLNDKPLSSSHFGIFFARDGPCPSCEADPEVTGGHLLCHSGT